jgi:hypothetical protein
MASSPMSPTDVSSLEPVSVKDEQMRKPSYSRKQEAVAPRTPSHSRNTSGSSIRTAIRVPKTREKEVQKVSKDSIGMPQMLRGLFDVGVSEERG